MRARATTQTTTSEVRDGGETVADFTTVWRAGAREREMARDMAVRHRDDGEHGRAARETAARQGGDERGHERRQRDASETVCRARPRLRHIART